MLTFYSVDHDKLSLIIFRLIKKSILFFFENFCDKKANQIGIYLRTAKQIEMKETSVHSFICAKKEREENLVDLPKEN